MPMLRSYELGPLTQAMALKHTQDKPVEKATRRAGVVPPMPAPALLTSVLHGRRSTRCCLMTHTAQSVCCCLMTAAAAPCARPRHCRLVRPRRQGAAPPAAPPKRPPPNPGSLACVSRTHPSPPALCHLPHMRCMILWCVVGGVAERGGGVCTCRVSSELRTRGRGPRRTTGRAVQCLRLLTALLYSQSLVVEKKKNECVCVTGVDRLAVNAVMCIV